MSTVALVLACLVLGLLCVAVLMGIVADVQRINEERRARIAEEVRVASREAYELFVRREICRAVDVLLARPAMQDVAGEAGQGIRDAIALLDDPAMGPRSDDPSSESRQAWCRRIRDALVRAYRA